MITRKAAIGFILLALIVFPIAYLSWSPTLKVTENTKPIIEKQSYFDDSTAHTKTVYRPPLYQFANPLDMAIAVTVIIETFTLLCYLALKRLEPYILEWERNERERVIRESE